MKYGYLECLQRFTCCRNVVFSPGCLTINTRSIESLTTLPGNERYGELHPVPPIYSGLSCAVLKEWFWDVSTSKRIRIPGHWREGSNQSWSSRIVQDYHTRRNGFRQCRKTVQNPNWQSDCMLYLLLINPKTSNVQGKTPNPGDQSTTIYKIIHAATTVPHEKMQIGENESRV